MSRTEIDVDLTSLHGVAQALTVDNPSVWSLASYCEVAFALFQGDLCISNPREASDGYRRIVGPIQEFCRAASPDPSHVEKARKYSQDVTPTLQAEIRHKLARVWNSPEYERWVQWHADIEWPEHIGVLGGLVEAANIRRIAQILGNDLDEVKAANDEVKAANEQSLRHPNRTRSNPTELQRRIFTVDVALRGRYYDELTKLANRRRIFHPIRRAILDPTNQTVGLPFDPVLRYLLPILGNWVCKEVSSNNKRVAAWIEILKTSRPIYWEQIEGGGQRARPADVASGIANKAGVSNPSVLTPGWKKVLEIISEGVGVAIAFYYRTNFPEAPVPDEMVRNQAREAVDFALNKSLGAFSKSNFAIGLLADRGILLGGRVFSYKDCDLSSQDFLQNRIESG